MFLSFLPNFTQAFFTVLLTEIHLLVPVESLINRRVEGSNIRLTLTSWYARGEARAGDLTNAGAN